MKYFIVAFTLLCISPAHSYFVAPNQNTETLLGLIGQEVDLSNYIPFVLMSEDQRKEIARLDANGELHIKCSEVGKMENQVNTYQKAFVGIFRAICDGNIILKD